MAFIKSKIAVDEIKLEAAGKMYNGSHEDMLRKEMGDNASESFNCPNIFKSLRP